MKYSHFEALVLSIGTAAVLGALVIAGREAYALEQLIAQVLLLVILFSAVHWGRNGGFVASLAASVSYVVLILVVRPVSGADLTTLGPLVARVLSFGLVGIVGGELCGRVRQTFERLAGSSSIDEWSQVFNQRFILRAFESSWGQYSRYQTPYSVLIISLAPTVLADLRPMKQRAVVRGIAEYIRSDIRLVDEAGRLDDGRFLVLLPHTTRPGALVVAERLHQGVCNIAGTRAESVTMIVLGADEDAEDLAVLRNTLALLASPA